MLRLAILTVALTLLLVGSADARERVMVGKATAGSAGLPVRKPFPPRFEIRYEPCPDYLPEITSCADQENAVIWLAPDADRFARWHELGHLFDAQLLTDADRAWFTALLDFEASTPWTGHYDAWVEYGGAVVPAEHFADAYAMCALGLSPAGRQRRDGSIEVGWTDAYGYNPSVRQHRAICAQISSYK
ncbi:MAG TPA: hypothetical protein VK631_17420 [Solirubrobacteraceae bacterium]|nr:hypothetical protein [Solirubrobacteraceae bacterium]